MKTTMQQNNIKAAALLVVTACFVGASSSLSSEGRHEHLRQKQQRSSASFEKGPQHVDETGTRDISRKLSDDGAKRTRLEGLTPFEQQEVVTMDDVIERFPAAFEARMDLLKERAQQATEYNLEPPTTPYLHMGFAKQGTSSIFSFWNCAGEEWDYTGTCHFILKLDWKYTERENLEHCFLNAEHKLKEKRYQIDDPPKPLFQSCGYPYRCMGYCQAENAYYGRIAQLDHLEEFFSEEPQMTLFLPFRNFQDWIQSQLNWSMTHSVTGGVLKDVDPTGNYLINDRDKGTPYPGLDAFDLLIENNKFEHMHYEGDDFSKRQEENQAHWLYECLENRSETHSIETVEIFKRLDQIRGVDNVARLAIFWVYYVTYVRSFAQNRQVELLEYTLEDPMSGEYMLDIFQIRNKMQRDKCWQHYRPDSKHEDELLKKKEMKLLGGDENVNDEDEDDREDE